MARANAHDEQSSPVERQAMEALGRKDREAALTVLMEAYGTAVYRFCLTMLRDEAVAEDVHQTVFVQAFESLGGFAGRSTLKTWLFRIARHRCLDALKASRRRAAYVETVDEPPEAPVDGGAEERLARRDLARALERCLEHLAPRVRAAVLLRFQQGLAYDEMARAFGERAGTLRVRVSRALPALRLCLEEAGVTL